MIDQIKIGGFLRELRKEKGLTQEELAEKFGLSSRSVSRWENGNTMPDLGMLVELADFYGVDIGELISGERKIEITENKDTLLRVADYAENEKKLAVKRRGIVTVIAAAAVFLLLLVLSWTAGRDVGRDIGEFVYHLTH
ncbi:MAG: helix-turn-helix transcriptional regulator [Lachnospiraceae bacterium]|nr:helix-turn-helix transcriptional regulator [Ruminococcus sp.]MCM1275894.1 helix-turn-helix transcriptional regulator [Lachnospiraceae bacterium]